MRHHLGHDRLHVVGLLDAVAEDLHILVLLPRYVLAFQGAVIEPRGAGVGPGHVQGSVPRVERVRPGQVEGVPGQSTGGMAGQPIGE